MERGLESVPVFPILGERKKGVCVFSGLFCRF